MSAKTVTIPTMIERVKAFRLGLTDEEAERAALEMWKRYGRGLMDMGEAKIQAIIWATIADADENHQFLRAVRFDEILDVLTGRAGGHNVAPFDMDFFCGCLRPQTLDSASRALDDEAERLARFAAYAGMRCGYGNGDQGHKDAVKKSNAVVRKVRKAPGYNTTRDLDF